VDGNRKQNVNVIFHAADSMSFLLFWRGDCRRETPEPFRAILGVHERAAFRGAKTQGIGTDL